MASGIVAFLTGSAQPASCVGAVPALICAPLQPLDGTIVPGISISVDRGDQVENHYPILGSGVGLTIVGITVAVGTTPVPRTPHSDAVRAGPKNVISDRADRCSRSSRRAGRQ